MLGAGSSFNLFTIIDFIRNQHNTYMTVTDLEYGVDRGFPDSLVQDSVPYTLVVSPAPCHSQFYQFHFSTPEVYI